jgi:hypothetical protein
MEECGATSPSSFMSMGQDAKQCNDTLAVMSVTGSAADGAAERMHMSYLCTSTKDAEPSSGGMQSCSESAPQNLQCIAKTASSSREDAEFALEALTRIPSSPKDIEDLDNAHFNEPDVMGENSWFWEDGKLQMDLRYSHHHAHCLHILCLHFICYVHTPDVLACLIGDIKVMSTLSHRQSCTWPQ